MVSRKLAITGTVAACAACCAPLVVPLVWPVLVAAGLVGAGSASGGWLAGLSVDAILCGGIVFAALAGGAVWLWQRGSECELRFRTFPKGRSATWKPAGLPFEGKQTPDRSCVRPLYCTGSASG